MKEQASAWAQLRLCVQIEWPEVPYRVVSKTMAFSAVIDVASMTDTVAYTLLSILLLSMRSPGPFSGEQVIVEVTDFIGAPEEIRTPDPQIRSLVTPIYPADR